MLTVLAVVLLAVVAYVVYGCIRKAETRDVRILLIHSYNKDLNSYKLFKEHLTSDFEEKDINADVRYEYLSLSDPIRNPYNDLMDIQRRMDQEGWEPEIIVVEGDPALQAINSDGLTIRSFWKVPVIATSIKFPDEFAHYHHPNIIVFEDTIDYRRNIDLAYELTGNKEIEIELDFFRQDSIIRKGLSKLYDDNKYFEYNPDSLSGLTDDEVRARMGDRISILTLSIANPITLRPFSDSIPVDRNFSKNTLRNIFIHSSEHPVVVLKHDLYSQILALKSGSSQFTATKESFANGTSRFLCGYFASFFTISKDIVGTVERIMNGEKLNGQTFTHKKDYYMDYKAMKLMGLNYEDYKDRFKIIGAPFRVANTFLFYAIIIMAALICIAALASLGMYIYELRRRHSTNLRRLLKSEQQMTNLILQGTEVRMINSIKDIENILAKLDHTWDKVAGEVRKTYNENGIFTFRLFAPLYDENISEWWQLDLAIEHGEEEEEGKTIVCGLLRNINQLVETEKEIEIAQKNSMEASDKHVLITDMTEAIYKPLGLIISSCDLLAEESDQPLSGEEKKALGKIINDNNSELMDIINDILNFSRLESRKTEYLLSNHSAKEICEQIYNEWVSKMPEGVTLMRNYGREDATVYCDGTHTHEVLRQFMSNAVKFTKKDTITIGYKTHLSTNKTQLFVEDAGCGIPEEKLDHIFDAFYKGDKFISGVGLGLNIASNLVQGMGGLLRVSSEEGIGSKFSARFKTKGDEN